MSVEMIERRYELPSEVWLRFFGGLTAFAKHVEDHFGNPQQPWQAVFGKSLCDRLANAPFHDHKNPELAGLYREVVEHLHEGILFAQQRPVYVRLTQERSDGPRPVFYFLAREGYVIVARGGEVRTAYFPNSNPSDPSHVRFENAWFDLRQKAVMPEYLDRKGGELVRQAGVQWISKANWATCPNPHPRKLEAPVEVSHA